MRSLMFAAAALTLLVHSADGQKRRSSRSSGRGVPCGRSYIAPGKVCHIAPTTTPSADTARRDTTLTPAAALVTAAPTATTGAWVGSTRGHTYYKAGCSGASKLAAANLVYFSSEADAKAKGYARSSQRGC